MLKVSHLSACIVIGASLIAATAFAKMSPLEGSTFDVKMAEVGKKQGPDKLIFASGKFTSTECTKYGFGPSAYKAKKHGKSWSFTAHAKSAKEGDAYWKGMITGNKISGTMRWVKKGQKPIRYKFAGQKQAQ